MFSGGNKRIRSFLLFSSITRGTWDSNREHNPNYYSTGPTITTTIAESSTFKMITKEWTNKREEKKNTHTPRHDIQILSFE